MDARTMPGGVAAGSYVTDAAPFPLSDDDPPWSYLEGLSPVTRSVVEARAAWIEAARPNQLPPPDPWDVWLLLAGRGFGKTRTLSEHAWYMGARNREQRLAVVAPTAADLRRISFEGESGLISRIPKLLLRGGSLRTAYNRTFSELYLENGTIFQGFSAEEPDRMRGPQFHHVFCEEMAAWKYIEDAWDILEMALRLGEAPRAVIATTPRPLPLLRRLRAEPTTSVSSGSTYDNRANLAPKLLRAITRHEGTKYGQQEIYGELLDDDEGAIFQRKWFRIWRKDRELPVFRYIVLSVDGGFKEKEQNDPSAMTAWGIFRLARQNEAGVWLPSKPCAMLLDLWAERLRFGDFLEKVHDSYKAKYGGSKKRLAFGELVTSVPGRQVDLILVEDKASGISLIQSLEDRKLPVESWNPGRMDKTMRAHSVSPTVLHGHVYLLETHNPDKRGQPADWCIPLVDQATQFTGLPGSIRHDDLLDTMTTFLKWAWDTGWLADGEPLGDEGATEAHRSEIKDAAFWPAVEDEDRGYGVRERAVAGGRNPYDG